MSDRTPRKARNIDAELSDEIGRFADRAGMDQTSALEFIARFALACDEIKSIAKPDPGALAAERNQKQRAKRARTNGHTEEVKA